MPNLFMTQMPARAPARAAAAALAALLVAGCSKEAPQQQRPTPEVSVLEVKPQTIPYTPTFVAQTESSRQVDIVARVSGFLDKIAYHEGELVKDGQVLFELDAKPFQAQLDSAKGELAAQQRLVVGRQLAGPRGELPAQQGVGRIAHQRRGVRLGERGKKRRRVPAPIGRLIRHPRPIQAPSITTDQIRADATFIEKDEARGIERRCGRVPGVGRGIQKPRTRRRRRGRFGGMRRGVVGRTGLEVGRGRKNRWCRGGCGAHGW